MDLETLYRRTTESWAAAVGHIRSDQWELSTPCSDWSVRELVNHVAGEDLWTRPMVAGSTIEEVGDRFDGDVLGADPVATAAGAAADAIDAMTAALPAGSLVHLSFGDTPIEEYARQLVADHVVHAWDLAAAIGAPRELDPDVVAEVSAWFAGWEEAYRGAGAIGPRPSVPDDADPQSVLLASFGRDPAWTG